MKKILCILYSVCLLAACSSDDDTLSPTTDPLKGDPVTTEQIMGEYELRHVVHDNTNHGIIKDKLRLTIKDDFTCEDFNPRTLDKKQFTWSYSDGIISFSNSLNGQVKGWFDTSELWFDKSQLKYRAYYIDGDGTKTNVIVTYTYVKQ